LARFVLVSDTTLSKTYRNVPLLDFLASAPTSALPGSVYAFLKGPPPDHILGRAKSAPYSLRKIEAGLRREYSQDDVAVAHEDHLEDFIDEETEVIGVTTMDPLGLGPLTMSFSVFFETSAPAYVQKEFESLLGKINRARLGKNAKLVVGGPGVWELSIHPEVLEENSIDYAYQGEADDIISDLFRYVVDDDSSKTEFFRGFQTFDDLFHTTWSSNPKFITRYQFSKQFPRLEEIPLIEGPTIKGMVEVMRGCGIGCDFCEVTLRPLRYYSPENVVKEVLVNLRSGQRNAWMHSDEIFAYKHGRNFVPNQEAIEELFTAVAQTKGTGHTNPTHGRISIPAAYPELIEKLSRLIRSGPDNWIGIQVGIETGSDRLAALHMPNKTLPLRIGPDGDWDQIVIEGTRVLNENYWRPAFTVQVGQPSETPEDNWETVSLINRMSRSVLPDGRPFEFTVTPMQNVPLGHLKARSFSSVHLHESQLAVYYACYRHLAKIAIRNATRASDDASAFSRVASGAMVAMGAWAMLRTVSGLCRKRGLDLEKASRHGLRDPLAVILTH
jgi:radical SAM superfamily enzyme YgiQ (UPF0313 family)